MPIFRIDRVIGVGRSVKVFLNLRGGLTRGAVPELECNDEQAENLRKVRQRNEKQRRRLLRQRVEITQLQNELNATNELLENVRQGPSSPRLSGEPEVGALPDFVIIGAMRCGTSQFYGLLTRHPNVERAAVKEVHYFDRPEHFDKGIDWYRRCFPPPKWKDGQRSITGEATPRYLFDPLVPERMARVVPDARLIVLLRNPVDRAYSHYHLLARRGKDARSFEEFIEEELGRLPEEDGVPGEPEPHSGVGNNQPSNLLARGIYVDQLIRWRRFFSEEQMLVLKSESFFRRTAETLTLVQNFLGLPHQKLNLPRRAPKDAYEPLNPITRERLKAYFEPHNRRLYEYLGVDFGW